MMKVLNWLDIYGTRFHFTLFNHSRYNTSLGGISSILSFVVLFIVTVIFSKPFFTRSTPIITSSDLSLDNYQIIFFNEKKINVAWRIEDLDGVFADFDGKIYPKIYYFSSVRDPNDPNGGNIISEEYLSYSICDQSLFSSFNVGGGKFYCIDWNDKKFGGYWDNYFLYYIDIQLHFCPDGKPYSKDNNCTSLEDLTKLFKGESNWFFSMYYPVYKFNPLETHEPIQISYKNYFFPLSHMMQKTDRIFLKEITLDDDQGIIFESKKKTTVWAVDQVTFDYSYFSEEQLVVEGTSSKFYSMNLYTDRNVFIYTRSYMKIQEVIAFLGSIARIIYIISKYMLHFFNKTMKDGDIVNRFFSLDQSFISGNTSSCNLHISAVLPLNNNTTRLQFPANKKLPQSLKPQLKRKKIINTHFSFWNVARFKIKTFCLKKPQRSILEKKFITGQAIITQLCDAKAYFSLFKDSYIIKNMLFNKEQINAIKEIHKLNLVSHNEIVQSILDNDKRKKMMNEYYLSILNQSNPTKVDQMIFQLLDPFDT